MIGFNQAPGYLEVRNGPLSGMSFPLQGNSVTIGRKGTNNIVLPDPMISGNHARIDIGPDQIIINDLGSSNGTIINGMRVQSQILREGDQIILGSTELVFHAGEAAPTVARLPLEGLEKSKKTGSKLGIIIGCIVGLSVIIAGLVITLLVLKKREAAKDITPPEVEIIKPESGRRYELPLYEGGTVDVEIEAKASDDRKINKVELYIDGEKVTVFSRDESGPYKYTFKTSQQKEHTAFARAFDEAGNTSDSKSITFTVWLDTAKKAMVETYVSNMDACVLEFNSYRSKLSSLVSKGQGLKQSGDPFFRPDEWVTGWTQVYQGTEAISKGLESLLAKAGALSKPSEFAAAHGEFVNAATALKKASDSANQWALYEGGQVPNASSFLGQYNSSWNMCDGHRASFNSLYEQACLALLGRQPHARF